MRIPSITITRDGQPATLVNCTAEQAAAAGAKPSQIAAAVTGMRRAAAKDECRRRIFSVVSAETQQNMNAAVAMIASKTAAQRSPSEVSMLEAYNAGLTWIKAMRDAVPQIASDANIDPADDAIWPECPPAVVALAKQF